MVWGACNISQETAPKPHAMDGVTHWCMKMLEFINCADVGAGAYKVYILPEKGVKLGLVSLEMRDEVLH